MNQYFRVFRLATVLGLMLTLLSGAARAQNRGAVSGALLDQSTGQPVPFASVVLLRALDSSFVAGVQTTEDGRFQLPVALGTYLLRATVLSYQPLRRTVSLTTTAPEAALGTLRLRPWATQLAGVTVQGEKAAVVDNLDKKVINVEKDLSSVGGTAVNVLQNVPSVSVDASGTVSMRGSSNITVLIDGKPSGAANGGTGTRLEQISASAIEKVEVVTNPSARYDAAGGGGVINIILKKQKKDGWNGQATLNLGTRDKYNPSLSLNRRTGKLNVFGSYDLRDDRYRNVNNSRQTTVLEQNTLTIDQNGLGGRHNRNHSGRVGFDYALTPEQSLSVTAEPSVNRGVNTAHQLATITTGTKAPQEQDNYLHVNENVNTLDLSSDYRRTWAAHKGRELTASVGYTALAVDVNVGQQLTAQGLTQPEWQQDFRVKLNVAYGQLDYTHPLDSLHRFDLGLKGQRQQSHGTDDYLLLQDPEQPTRVPDRSFAYDFTEYVQAGYATYQGQQGKWSYQGGLRAEYTHTYGAVIGRRGGFDLDYLNLFPSATVARTLAHDQKLQLSYARRLNRPGFMQLLAFPLYQDPRYYRLGDPSVRPEYINAFELGHQVSMGSTSVNTTVFYRQTNNALQRVREVDTLATRLNGAGGVVTAELSKNLGQSTSYGAEMSLTQPLAKWWRLTASGSLFRNSITAATGTELSRRNVTGTLRLQNTFNPTAKLDVQLTGSYRAAVLTPQGRLAPQGGLDVALRQRLFNDRGALTLRVSDVLNTQRQRITAFGPGFAATYDNKYETRVGYLGFSWYFGSNKPPKKIENQPQGGGGGFGG